MPKRKSKVEPHAEAILQQLRAGLTMPEVLEELAGLDVHPNTAREFFYTKDRRPAYDAALKAGEEARGGVPAKCATRDTLVKRHGDEILSRLERGEFMEAIARDLGFPSRTFRHAMERDPELRKRYEEARRVGAESMVAEALNILDTAKPTSSADAMILKERAGMRKWLAEKFDPETFGNRESAVAINLSFGESHLEALKELGSMDRRREIPEADYELLEDGAVDAP